MRLEQIVRAELHYLLGAFMGYTPASEQAPTPFEEQRVHSFNFPFAVRKKQLTREKQFALKQITMLVIIKLTQRASNDERSS
jgi:hypothetical protein